MGISGNQNPKWILFLSRHQDLSVADTQAKILRSNKQARKAPAKGSNKASASSVSHALSGATTTCASSDSMTVASSNSEEAYIHGPTQARRCIVF